jgi:hypothetical protein
MLSAAVGHVGVAEAGISGRHVPRLHHALILFARALRIPNDLCKCVLDGLVCIAASLGRYSLAEAWWYSVSLYQDPPRRFLSALPYPTLHYTTLLPYLPYLTLPYPTQHYPTLLTLPYLTYLTLPYLPFLTLLTLPYPTLHYPTLLTLPYLTLPYLTSSQDRPGPSHALPYRAPVRRGEARQDQVRAGRQGKVR